MHSRLTKSTEARLAGAAALAVATLLGVTGCGIFRGQEAPSAYVGDSAISAHVKSALIKTPGVRASEIDVDTYEGVVTLNGVVDDEQMMKRAEKVARDTPGVKAVHSTLQVASTAGTTGDEAQR